MNGFNFTERTRNTLAVAREEAVRLDHEYIGTEHILLAVLADRDGVAHAVLESLGTDRDAIRAKVDEVVTPGRRTSPVGPDLPYTTRAKRVLELANTEATELQHPYLGTEHLLLGLLREEKGVGAQVLTHSGVTLSAARADVLRLLGHPVA